ncbi:MAG: methyl-accepting chemotaxis protein [Candidatus Methylomirabilia bacterium]
MKWFVDLAIRTKVLIGFGVMWLFLAAVTVVAYRGLEGIRLSELELHDNNFQVALELRAFRANQNFTRAKILEMMLAPEKASKEKLEAEIRAGGKEQDALLENLLKIAPDPQCQAAYRQLQELLAAYRRNREQQIVLIHAGKVEEARLMGLGEQEDLFEKLGTLATVQAANTEKEADGQLAIDQAAAKSSELLFVSCAGAALLFAGFMTVLMNKSIAQPLSGISKLATQVAGGDLAIALAEDPRRDEIGTLGRAFRLMVENLRRSTAEIREAVNLLGSTASKILTSTTQVATGTAETATAISETTTTVEEVRQAAQLSSQKAQNVADSAQRVAQVGQAGQKSVDEVVAGMEHIRTQMGSIAATIVRLSEQSQSIGGIIAAVTDIADQSNLLAVNAAIEATRAGEQGKAFGVVAQEIKSLAEQSKQATLQVRGILSDVQRATSAAVMATEQGSKSVEAGVRQSAQAGEAITRLAESSLEAVQTATQIVASSQQQVVGMDQIGLAMENINKAGAQTAASTTQVETAARNLNEMGQKLKTLVEQFKG